MYPHVPEMLSHSRGRYTPDQINRVATMSVAFRRFLHEEVLQSLGMRLPLSTETHISTIYKKDVATFVSLLRRENLFSENRRPAFQGLEQVAFGTTIEDKDDFVNKLIQRTSTFGGTRSRALSVAMTIEVHKFETGAPTIN